MTRTDRTKRVTADRADGYAEVGRRLLQAGRVLAQHDDPRHASALAILSVHAVIAFVDAVTIHSGGRKSSSPDHAAATRLLRDVLGTRLPEAQAKLVARIIAEKDRFEYQGYVARWDEACKLHQNAERVGAWAGEYLAVTPRRGD